MSRGDRVLALLVMVMAATVLVFADQFAEVVATVTRWTVHHGALAFIWLASAMLVVAMGLVLSPWGGRRLGVDETARPEFGLLAWSAMLFAAGMGSGLVFWGLAEPLTHWTSPPDPGLQQPADALAVTYFHWGLHAWAIYAVAGLSIGYFCHRRGLQGSIGLPIASQLGTRLSPRSRQWLANSLDQLAIIAVLFGVAGSLGNGVDLLRIGLDQPGTGAALVLLSALGIAFVASAWTGLKRGIRVLSLVNLALAGVLLVTMAIMAWDDNLGTLLVASVRQYLVSLPSWSMQLIGPVAADGRIDSGWAEGWSVVYLLWWVAWTPFVGVFLARISAGRTVRGYLLGVILIPTIASIGWFWIFGGAGLLADEASGGHLSDMLSTHYTAPLFGWYQQLPLTDFLRWGTLALLFVFLVTSADSAVYVMSGLNSRQAARVTTGRQRTLWGVLMLLIAVPLVMRADVDLNKQVAIAGAVPFTLVLIAQTVSLLSAMWRDAGAHPDDAR